MAFGVCWKANLSKWILVVLSRCHIMKYVMLWGLWHVRITSFDFITIGSGFIPLKWSFTEAYYADQKWTKRPNVTTLKIVVNYCGRSICRLEESFISGDLDSILRRTVGDDVLLLIHPFLIVNYKTGKELRRCSPQPRGEKGSFHIPWVW